MRKLITIVAITSILAGCGSTSKNDTQSVITNLENKLATEQTKNNELFNENRLLKLDVERLNGVVSVLDTERDSRVQESSLLRSQVRKFVQNKITLLKEFLVEGDLLDYVGGELVQRTNNEEKPMTLVDLNNRINSAGVLTGIGAYVNTPSDVKVKVLRYIESNLVVVWESAPIKLYKLGLTKHQFVNTVGVEKGDVIAYEFERNVGVGYSEGTSDTRFSRNPIALGNSIHVKELEGANSKRAYSIGVYGLLNQ